MAIYDSTFTQRRGRALRLWGLLIVGGTLSPAYHAGVQRMRLTERNMICHATCRVIQTSCDIQGHCMVAWSVALRRDAPRCRSVTHTHTRLPPQVTVSMQPMTPTEQTRCCPLLIIVQDSTWKCIVLRSACWNMVTARRHGHYNTGTCAPLDETMDRHECTTCMSSRCTVSTRHIGNLKHGYETATLHFAHIEPTPSFNHCPGSAGSAGG